MKILVFTEGTIIMHKSAAGVSRLKRVWQSATRETSVSDFVSYIPNGKAVDKLNTWKEQGAEIFYLTSRTDRNEIEDIQNVLKNFSFPDYQNLLFRKSGQEYKDVAEELMPDVLIEDDCQSIGGKIQMTYPHISKGLKKKIKSIVVEEFAGIDRLPDEISML